MATTIHQEYPIPTIIQFAEQAQVLSQLKISQQNFFRSGAISPDYSRTLYMVRSGVAFLYATSPNFSTLRQTSEYLLALCRPFGTMQIPPPPVATISITNPANQSTTVGGSATFCVTVTVSTGAPYTIQWFKNGVLIVGATSPCYTQTNAQLTDNGATYNAVAMTAGLPQAVSAMATITVTAALVGDFAYMDTDPGPTLRGGSDPFSYQLQFPIVHNASFTISAVGTPIPFASSPNKFLIVRVPSTEPAKGNWFNDSFNNGIFPDFNWQTPVTFGGKTYYYSRQGLSLNTSNTLVLST